MVIPIWIAIGLPIELPIELLIVLPIELPIELAIGPAWQFLIAWIASHLLDLLHRLPRLCVPTLCSRLCVPDFVLPALTLRLSSREHRVGKTESGTQSL